MISSTLLTDPEPNARTLRRTEPRRAVTRGGLAYVGAWLSGLALKPVGVASTDGGAAVAAHYLDHRATSILQVLLVHAGAAVALGVFAAGLGTLAAAGRLARQARWVRATAAVAVALSVAQAVLGLVMIATAGSLAPSSTRGLLVGVERLDAVKLVALALVCGAGAVLASRGVLARWTGRLAAAGSGLLAVAAVGFAGIAPVLTPVAVPALVLLLAWVGAVALTARRIER